MQDPSVIRARLVAVLQGISGLVSLFNSSADFVEYTDEENGDFYSTINSLSEKLLVAYEGTSPGRYPALWQHKFLIVIRPKQGVSPSAVFSAIVNGVSTVSGSDGLPLVYSTIDPKYHPMALPELSRRSVPISDTASFDFWVLTTTFVSKGIE